MKKLYFLVILLSLCLGAFSQEITVRFTGQLNGTDYCRLDSVAVTNLTRDWSETVEYPDTIIVLGGLSGVNMNIPETQGLGQNIPNPFDCETSVELTMSQRENVRLQLLDVSGKIYAEYSGTLNAGIHIFDITAATPQTYLLNAIVGSRSYSIRMVNMGSGCTSDIKYAGGSDGIEAKLTSANEFQSGDNMRYVGYATVDGEIVTSIAIEQMQVESEDITLNFTVCWQIAEHIEVTACDFYQWNNENYTESGEYQQTFSAANGCDSVVTLHLTVNYSNTGIDEQTACDSYTWIDGNTYTESTNVPIFTLTNAEGCDSVVTLHLTVNYSNAGVDEQTACDSYTWIDGNTYTESTNEPIFTLTNAAGCDSVVTLHLTVNHSNTGVDEQTACDSYTWIDGNTYTESTNEPIFTLTNAAGCDSVVTLHLTINYSNTGIDEQAACDSYTWIDGNTYTASTNEPTFTLTNAAGCDSVVTLHLTVNNSSTGIDEQIACDSYTWIDGNTYTASTNEPIFTLTNAEGCDSVVTLHLTVNYSSTGIDEQIACDSYTWIDGNTYTASTNEPIFTLTNAEGCDSVVTLHLTIVCPPTVETISAFDITYHEATLSGNVSSDGGATITARGFVYGTSANNLTQTVQSGSGTGSYTKTITGLTHSTTYYYKAYATNSVGTSYGEVKQFTTPVATYLITFNANGGTGTMASQTFTAGIAQTLLVNTFTRTNYIFKGWNTVANGSGTSYTNSQQITVTANMTLYAQWMALPTGGINGAFSVSATKQVIFSNGNLQYQGSTAKWRFAENQYTMVGRNAGNTSPSATQTGWIDLYGWGTSGYNSKYPYMTSMSDSQYDNGLDDIAGTQYDWGVRNAISNGGNQANMWRTLTYAEWDYLINTRANASNKRALAKVNGVNGCVLLPDDWTLPSGCSFTAGVSNGFSTNTYTMAKWTLMENAGAVFLPAAGCRLGTSTNTVGQYGFYWSTNGDNDSAHYFSFTDGSNDDSSARIAVGTRSGYRYRGKAVRLVKTIE